MNRIFAIGDIHGCLRTFQELVIKIINIDKSDKLILLGDYIDRGDQIKETVDFIIGLKEEGFDVHPLMGNHEKMLLDSVSDNKMYTLWMMNMGITTLESFHIQEAAQLEKKYLDFFSSLEYYLELENFLFVHAGFNDYLKDPFIDKEAMIWDSTLNYRNPVFNDKIIVHGHRPRYVDHVRNLLKQNPKVIPVDTGCVYEKELGYGFLSALDIRNMELISLPRQ